MKRIELADEIPYGFPFIAMMRGGEQDYKRLDFPVIVLGFAGMERHYFRIQHGVHENITVVSDSMLYIEA